MWKNQADESVTCQASGIRIETDAFGEIEVRYYISLALLSQIVELRLGVLLRSPPTSTGEPRLSGTLSM